MASADFSQFVVTTAFFRMTSTLPPVRPPRVLTRSFTLIPALFTASDSVQLLGFDLRCSLTLACGLTRFLFVGSELCPWRDLSTLQIRLPSDSASRRTPLPLANASRCRARSGLSPYRTCAHRAHNNLPRRSICWTPREISWWQEDLRIRVEVVFGRLPIYNRTEEKTCAATMDAPV